MGDPRRPRVDLIEAHHRTERARHRRRRERSRRRAAAASGAASGPGGVAGAEGPGAPEHGSSRGATSPEDAQSGSAAAPSGRGLIFDDPQEHDERRRRRRHRGDPAIVRVNRHQAVRLRPTWRRIATALGLVVLALVLVVGVVAWYVAPDPAGWVGDAVGRWTDALRDWVLGLLAIRES